MRASKCLLLIYEVLYLNRNMKEIMMDAKFVPFSCCDPRTGHVSSVNLGYSVGNLPPRLGNSTIPADNTYFNIIMAFHCDTWIYTCTSNIRYDICMHLFNNCSISYILSLNLLHLMSYEKLSESPKRHTDCSCVLL